MARLLLTLAAGVLLGAGLMSLSPLANHAALALHALHSWGRRASTAPDAVHTDRTFEFTVRLPVESAAPLFGADKERAWAPGWNPAFIWPASAKDQPGMVFEVAHGSHSAVWIAPAYDPERGFFQYVYIIPDVMATLVAVKLTPQGERTQVAVRYERTALNPAANAMVLSMADEDSRSGPEWERQIDGYLGTPAAAH